MNTLIIHVFIYVYIHVLIQVWNNWNNWNTNSSKKDSNENVYPIGMESFSRSVVCRFFRSPSPTRKSRWQPRWLSPWCRSCSQILPRRRRGALLLLQTLWPAFLSALVAEDQEGLPWPLTDSSSHGFSGRRDFLPGLNLAPSLSTAQSLWGTINLLVGLIQVDLLHQHSG